MVKNFVEDMDFELAHAKRILSNNSFGKIKILKKKKVKNQVNDKFIIVIAL